MSKLTEFLKKTLAENQAGYRHIDKKKEQEQRRLEIDAETKKREKQQEKFRRLFEFEIQEKYREHRIALQCYRDKLAALELQLTSREAKLLQSEEDIERRIQEISIMKNELAKREEGILSKEAEEIKSAKEKIRKYLDKKKREIKAEEAASKENLQWAIEELKKYEQAVYAAEYRVIDWMKRVDRKEHEVFEEIRQDVEECKKANPTPPKDGFDFERKLADALRHQGFESVVVTEKSGDFGADILAEKENVKYVIQCKYYASSVGVKAVQQVFASKIHYSAHVAVVATNSVFTKSAKVLAEEAGVLLWNGCKVQEILTGTKK